MTDEAMIEAMARAICRAAISHPTEIIEPNTTPAIIDNMVENLAIKFYPEAQAALTFLTELKQEIRRETLEEALRTVAELRCERGTPWDRALLVAMDALRTLSEHPVPTEETK